MPSAKKYKLSSKSGDGKSRPVCAFFTSAAGCKNGDNCPFLHGSQAPSQGAGATEISDAASVISSEESVNDGKKHMDTEEDLFAPSGKAQPNKQPPANKNKKRKSASSGDDLFANPKEKTATPNWKKVKQENPVVPTTPALKKEHSVQVKEDVPSFRNLLPSLPVAAFSIPGVSAPAKPSNEQPSTPSEKVETPIPSDGTVNLPLPTSSERGRKWVEAVKYSRKHERYAGSFDFEKYKEASRAGGVSAEWIKTKPYGAWCAANPQAIAIDCEMCETKDPLSGTRNHKALCRLSVVNAENPEEVLLDTLVKPSWPVVDYRTRINGISKEDLDGVEFTLRHAQAFMMALCSEETVIVGHAVQNDLASLRMEHYCVADSSFLFHAKDSTTVCVSLKDLVQSLFQKDMPNTHDSVNDARKALDCVNHWVEKGGNVNTIERTPRHKGHQLFIHRIPKQCKIQHLTKMFLSHTTIEPTSIDEIEFSGETGKTHVTFKSARHANLAFDTLEGNADADKSGRLQKKVYLRNNDYVRVRKNVTPNRGGTPSKEKSAETV